MPRPHRRPVNRTLVSPAPANSAPILEPTPYREDPNGSRPSDAYVGAQAAVLRQITNRPEAPFTVTLAQRFTRMTTNTKEALRLCYYMRSLGLSTFSKLKPELREVHLFIRGQGGVSDVALYWAQNWNTQFVAVGMEDAGRDDDDEDAGDGGTTGGTGDTAGILALRYAHAIASLELE